MWENNGMEGKKRTDSLIFMLGETHMTKVLIADICECVRYFHMY